MKQVSYNETIMIKREKSTFPGPADVLVIREVQVISGVKYNPTTFKDMVKYSYYGTPSSHYSNVADAYAESYDGNRHARSASEFYAANSELEELCNIFGI